MNKGHIAVIGAGVVGAACALALASDGWKVSILEPNDPGSGCSMGNAGIIGTAAIMPWSTPDNVRNSWKMMLDAHHPLKIPIRAWRENARWLARFVAVSRPASVATATTVLNELCSRGWTGLSPLVEAAGGHDLVSDLGTLQVFSSPEAAARARGYNELRRKFGHEVIELTGDQIREMEPSLGPGVAAGVHLKGSKSILDPQGLVRRFVSASIQRGGVLIAQRVVSIEPEGARIRVATTDGTRLFDKVVLTAGIWSRRFFHELGVTIPLAAERGFHLQMTGFATLLGRPVSFMDRRVVASPMQEGLRLTTGAVFGGTGSSPQYDLARRIFEKAKPLLPALNDLTGREWSGFRPSSPDSLPIIGESPRLPGVIVATGHGHAGLCMSGVTANLVTLLANGKISSSDLGPLGPGRKARPSADGFSLHRIMAPAG